MERGVVVNADLESDGWTSSSGAPLLGARGGGGDGCNDSTTLFFFSKRSIALTMAAFLVLAVGSVLILRHHPEVYSSDEVDRTPRAETPATPATPARGVREGVSSKESGVRYSSPLLTSTGEWVDPYRWSNDELQWQRTAYHFQPEKNWMNDPNGPLYYKGWYHLFYQYNPDSAVWGNITWGHSASPDLINWIHLPLAMVPDRWYDANGAWTGSATILPTGEVVMLYTGSTNESVQVQNLAVPADPEDPLLIEWIKSDSNPILFPPAGIEDEDFRDPTTAWYDSSDSAWRVAIGSKNANYAGVSLLYKTKDFVNYELLPEVLHGVPGTGMWECVDFFPVSKDGESGLDTSENGPHVRHVLKASLDDDRYDYYAIGTYDAGRGIWTPDDPEVDVGIGAKYDYGKFYAAKTFFDAKKNRRILWGWISETDSEKADVRKGWASLMALPRTILLDQKTGTNLLQWPVEEVERLRTHGQNFSDLNITAGSVVPLDIGTTDQLDITVEFEIPQKALDAVFADSNAIGYNCSTSSGATESGVLGPFGVLILADQNQTEQTAVYFYIAKSTKGKFDTFFCQDEIMSSQANDIVKQLPGIIVPVLDGENLYVRILVDHSIVESFAQGGRTCITSRVYPTQAIYGATRIFLFNNATNEAVIAKSINVWRMKSAFLLPYAALTGKTMLGWNDQARWG